MLEAHQLRLGFHDLSQGGVGNPFRVVVHRGGNAIEFWIGRQRGVNDVLPTSEPHQNVHFRGVVALHRHGHVGLFDRQQFRGQSRHHALSGLERSLVLPGEHGRIHHHVKVMAAGGRVEVERTRMVEILVVRGNGLLADRNRLRILSANGIDVGGHVLEVPCVRAHVKQRVGGIQGTFRRGRHFPNVEVEVEECRMRRQLAFFDQC